MYRMMHNNKDITGYCSEVSLNDNIDTISKELTFSIPFNPKDRYLHPPDIEPGDRVGWNNDNNEIFYGIVISVSLDGQITANDYGYFLNKSQIILQTNAASGDETIRAMCKQTGVLTGEICSIPTKITKIWVGSTPDQILKDIFELATAEQGKNYLYRVENNRLNVRPYPTEVTTAYYQQKASGKKFDVTWSLGEVSVSKSMENLSNKIIAVNGSDSNYKVLTTAEDSESQGKYGMISTVLTIDDDKTKNAESMAKAKLKELNVITHSISIGSMFGSDDVKAGVIMNFSSDAYGVKGLHLVTEVTHNYATDDPARHTMSLTVQKVVSA